MSNDSDFYAELTDKHELVKKEPAFVREYMKDNNATQAAIRAGYSPNGATATATRLMKRPRIAAAVKEAQARLAKRCDVQVEDVVRELSRITFFDPRKLFDDAGEPIPLSMLPDDVAMAIQSVKVVNMGNSEVGRGTALEYRMADRNSAADKLMKHLGGYLEDNKQRSLAEADTDEIRRELARKLLGADTSLSELMNGRS